MIGGTPQHISTYAHALITLTLTLIHAAHHHHSLNSQQHNTPAPAPPPRINIPARNRLHTAYRLHCKRKWSRVARVTMHELVGGYQSVHHQGQCTQQPHTGRRSHIPPSPQRAVIPASQSGRLGGLYSLVADIMCRWLCKGNHQGDHKGRRWRRRWRGRTWRDRG